MGRRNTQLRPTFFENKCQKRWLRIEQPKPCPGLIWAASLRLSDSSVEVLAEHLIRWCGIDRLNRQRLSDGMRRSVSSGMRYAPDETTRSRRKKETGNEEQ